jgi:hypothetical protein
MAVQSTPQGKICTHCGQDCSAKPRTKDKLGKYYCKECFGEAMRAAEARLAAAAQAVQPAPIEPVGEPIVFDIAEPDAPGIAVMETCPRCSNPLAAGVVLCTSCGFNRQSGQQLKVQKEAPEPKPVKKGRGRSRDSAATVKEAYLKPVALFVVGAVGSCIIVASQTGNAAAAAGYLLQFAITVPLGLLVFWLCSAMWIGFDAPIHLTALNLAGIYAASDLASNLLGLTGLPILGWAVGTVTYVGLLVDMLELELQDAVIVALVTFIVKIVIIFTVVAMLVANGVIG